MEASALPCHCPQLPFLCAYLYDAPTCISQGLNGLRLFGNHCLSFNRRPKTQRTAYIFHSHSLAHKYCVLGALDNGLELSCPAEVGRLPPILAQAAGPGALPYGRARRVSFSELLGCPIHPPAIEARVSSIPIVFRQQCVQMLR